MSFKRKLLRWPTLFTVTTLHLLWGIMLCLDQRAIHITALTWLAFGSPEITRIIALFLITIASLGAWAISRDLLSWRTLLALMPQQTILWMSAISGLYFTWLGRYGDGILRPHAFILIDQLPIILLTLMHTYVLANIHRTALSKKEAQ